MSKLSYPPRYIHLSDLNQSQTLYILQLTDLHLKLVDCDSNESEEKCGKRFRDCLTQAMSENYKPDLILVTGDLIHEMDSRIYDYIFDIIKATGIPFACVAGNHDVTDEIGEDFMPFEDYQLVGYTPDTRLLNQYVVETDQWQIILLDSSVSGKVCGQISQAQLLWLEEQLNDNQKPAVICMHHHVLPMDSHWLDQHILINADEFWKTIRSFDHLKVVLHGHVHQEFSVVNEGVQVLATPATCYQFEPSSEDFRIDKSRTAGYRWLMLHADGSIDTQVVRLRN